jgi:hypothetical protein
MASVLVSSPGHVKPKTIKLGMAGNTSEKKIYVVVTNLTQSNGEIVVLGHLTEGMD